MSPVSIDHRALVAGAVLLACLAVGTASRVRVWQSDRTLWTATVAEAPQDIRALINLAVDAIQRGDETAAEQWLDAADRAPLGLDGSVAREYVRANRVSLRLRQGRYVDAQALVRSSPPRSIARHLCPQYPTLDLCGAPE